MNWDRYLNKGFIKKQKPNFSQIEQQILRAEKDLETFNLVMGVDPEWASTIAYQSMLRMGRALMFSFGFLPADGQQHKTMVEITGRLLGDEYGHLVRYFDRMRRKRNLFFYESIDDQNEATAKKAYETAKKLLKAVTSEIKSNNPQFSLK